MKKLMIALISSGLLIGSCSSDEKLPALEMENQPFIGTMNYVVTSQTVVGNTVKVVVEGAGSFSFDPDVKLYDAFTFNLSNGSASHVVTYTATNGDKIFAEMVTQAGETGVEGSTLFTGGTGRFAKITGGSKNLGTQPDKNGAGNWKETGKITF